MAIIHSQFNFANGEISPRFWGRTDIPIYSQGVAKATNVIITESGSIRKRPGFETIIAGDNTAKTIPFRLPNNIFFIVELTTQSLRVIETETNTVVINLNTEYLARHIPEIKYAQQDNSLYFTHREYAPIILTYTGVDWLLATDSITGWDSTGNFPGVVSFYKQRKIFASTNTHPRRMGLSEIGDFTNFVVGNSANDAISIDLASDANDRILAILPFETFIVFTEAGVWVNNNPAELTSSNISFTKRSNIGISTLVNPLIMKNNIFYVPDTEDDILLFKFDFNSAQYTSDSITKTVRHIFEGNQISSCDISNLFNLIIIVFNCVGNDCLEQKTVCVNYDLISGIQGWSVWETAAAVSNVMTDNLGRGFYFINTRNSQTNLEYLNILGSIFIDPNSSLYTMNIITLPLEGIGTFLQDKKIVSSLYVKMLDTGPFEYKSLNRIDYINYDVGEDIGGVKIYRCPTQGENEFFSQVFFKSTNNTAFELLSYAVGGDAASIEGKHRVPS